MITIRLLGVIDVRDADGQEITAVLSQPKRLALLAYLATPSPGGHHRRDTLLGLFWPDLDSDHARNALSKAVHFLREALGPDAIVARSAEELALDPARIWTDIGAFEDAVATERYEEALRHYQGDLLPAVYFSDSAPFEQWLEETRTRHRSRVVRASRLEAERQEAARNYTRAIDVARRGAELSQDDERTLRRLLSLLYRLGDRAGALSMYERFARRLADELDSTPAPETVALIEEIRSAHSPATPSPPSPPAAVDLAPSPPSLQIALGERYQVVREIGSGSSARVYLAEDRKLRREVAIKVLRPTLAGLGQAAKFEAEILVAARLNHPHVVPLLDAGEAAGLLFYVMPHVAGETLREKLGRSGRLPVPEALAIARDVADALRYAHGRGFVHRDIKPENILLADGHALVTDFGIARVLTATPGPGEGGSGSGTPMYASPEQVDGTSPEDGRGDIYSLGCVLYELLAGRPPFEAATISGILNQHRETPPPSLINVRPEVPAVIASLVTRAMAKRPMDRPADAAAFLAALRDAPDPGARPSAGQGRWRLVAGLTVAALVSAGSWWRLADHPIAPSDRPELLLASVDAGLDSGLGRAMELAMSTDLLGSPAYRLVSPQRIAAAQRRMGRAPDAFLGDSAARELAEREGIPLIATITARPLAGKFVVAAKVAGPDGTVFGAALAIADSQPLVAAAMDTISRFIRRLAGEGKASVASRPPLQQVTTASLPALRLYSESMRPGPDVDPLPAAVRLLEEAIRLDTTFAMAYRRLAGQYWLHRRFDEGRKALHLAERYRDRLTYIEQQFVDADLAIQVRFDTLGRRQALDRILALDPDNAVALRARASYELYYQRPVEARPFLDRALRLDSLSAASWEILFGVRLIAGDTAGARAVIEPWISTPRYVNGVPSFLSMLAWRTGELAHYQRRLDSTLAAHPPDPDNFEEATRIRAVTTFLAGRHVEGTRLWDAHAAAYAPGRAAQVLASSPFRRAQCDALFGGDLAATASYLTQAESAFDLRSLPPDERAGTVMYLAGAWAYAGHPARARALLLQWWPRTAELAPFIVATRWMMDAHILEAGGHDDAVLALGRAHLRSPLTVQLALPMSWAFQRKGEIDSAITYGELYATRFTYPFLTADWSCAEQMLHMRLGTLYLQKGLRRKAAEHFRRVVRMWEDPDPSLRPFVDQARASLGLLDRTATPLD